jgi:hypothetical protein
MKKRFFALCLMILMLASSLAPMPALSEDPYTGALSYEELIEWAERYTERAKTQAPLNAPVGTESLTEDGYAHIYSFATLYFDKPVLDDDTHLNAIAVYSELETLPRGLCIDAGFNELIHAFYSENDHLYGTHDFAYLYVSDTMPMGAMWGWVERSGQRPQTVQYAIHEQVSNAGDGYTDCGLIYTIQSDTIVAMRAYGLNQLITEDKVTDILSQVKRIALERDYYMYPKSLKGDDVNPLEREDLSVSGLDFISAVPGDCEAIFGHPLEDVWLEDDDTGYLRMLTYDGATFTFTMNADRQSGTLLLADITNPGIEGPRGVAVGESFYEIYQRFMHSQGSYDGTSTEWLYGEPGTTDFGTAEYGDDGRIVLRYSVDAGFTLPVTLQLVFEMDELINMMLYRW